MMTAKVLFIIIVTYLEVGYTALEYNFVSNIAAYQ